MTESNKYGRVSVLYTGGTFDLFHAGHVHFLFHCRKLSNHVVVSLNTDEFVARYKGTPPIISYEERKDVLLSCRYVDDVIPNFGGDDSKPSILEVKPSIIAVGDDWAMRNYYQQMRFTQKWLDDNGITLVYVAFKRVQSSTMIKEKL